MLSDNEKMTLLLKDRLKKAAATTVILEVFLGIFNSFSYNDNENGITAYFKKEELPMVHEFFNSEYNKALETFFSLGEEERNAILDQYILNTTSKK